MTEQFLRARSALLVFLGASLVAALIYWPGLAGSFAFDDSTALIDNPAIRVSTLNFSDWVSAAMSFPGSTQGRWLGMLSFAGNHFLTGMDPYWFKLTNLCIHLLNGLLLYLGLRALFDLHHACRSNAVDRPTFNAGMAAAALAGLWLVLPINLTGVLYISQRLESLSNTFVFLGLWWYLRARLAHWQGRKGPAGMWLALIVSTSLGLLVKESAILLPLYTFLAEFVLTGGRNREGRWNRPVLALYSSLLMLPLLGGLAWLNSAVGSSSSYGRTFDIPQRLMTEGRVLIDYMVWILAPSLDALTLYHDDIKVSKSLLDPPTTLAAFIAIAGLLGAALWQRKRRPLFALGVFWYFGGHVLTATVIPLMLVFEHRNYFPSVGLLLAAASLLVLEGPLLRARTIAFGVTLLFAFYAFTTALRALEWSSPLQLAATDAAKRPDSSAAQYEYARNLLSSTLNGDPEPMRLKAFVVLERMAARADADAVHNQLLIVTSAKLGLPIKDVWWDTMIAKLRAHPPTSVDASAMTALLRCYDKNICPKDIDHLRQAFAAATSHPGGFSYLLSAHGQFALNYLDGAALAERQFRTAIHQSPSDPITRTDMVVFLARIGRVEEARAELENLRQINRLGALDKRISDMEQILQHAEAKTALPLPTAESNPSVTPKR